MAVTLVNCYAAVSDLKDVKEIKTTNPPQDSVLADYITAASRWIDNYTGRTFYARTETHYFDVPKTPRNLRLDDDLLTLTTLTNGDGTVIASSNYKLWPYNTSPKHEIQILRSANIYWLLSGGIDWEAAISVAGTWGYSSTTPAPIKSACIDIAVNAYGRRHGENTSGIARVTSAGVVLTPRDIPDGVKTFLNDYIRAIL